VKKFYIIGFFILLCFDTLTQTSFKLAAVATAPAVFELAWIGRLLAEKWVYVAVFSYIGAFISYMTLLKHAPIGPAFAATHLEIVTVTLVSVLFLGEKLTALQVAGSVLIMAGIFLLGTEPEADTKPIPSPEPEPVARVEAKDVA
jgi:drug/metabolite transporter (DMT)-like permease